MLIQIIVVFSYLFPNQISASCPYIRTSVLLKDCVFDARLYLSLGARLFNSNSIDFLGHYSLNSTEQRITNPLIYNRGHRWMLVVPLLLKCAHQPVNLTFTECQYTMRASKHTIVEYMTTQLSVMNMTDLGRQSVLFLQPGEIILRSCKAYDCSKELVYLTTSNTTFNFRINYEKAIGTKCRSDIDCGNSYAGRDFIQCDHLTETCQCFDETIPTIDVPGIGRLCTDSIDRSNCTKSPQRCLQWCNASRTSHCICPKYTRKVRKINGIFDCELEPMDRCRFDDDQQIGWNIRKCPTGTICDGYRCQTLTIYRQLFANLSDSSTTTHSMLFSSTIKPHLPAGFLRILIIIALASLLFFLVIVFIIVMLIKTHRFDFSSSSDEKISSFSSSSFARSSSTMTSNDYPPDIYQFKSHTYDSSRHYYPTYLPGLLPQANLSPRFSRSYHGFNDRQRQIPVQIQSPIIRHLQNGDVLISA